MGRAQRLGGPCAAEGGCVRGALAGPRIGLGMRPGPWVHRILLRIWVQARDFPVGLWVRRARQK